MSVDENLISLVRYGPTGISLALLGLMFGIIKLFLKQSNQIDQRHSRAFDRLSIAIDKNTRMTNETYQFLRNLNGSLKKNVEEKRKR